MRRYYALLLSRGWTQVGPRPGFNRPQHWAHVRNGNLNARELWRMTDQAVREEGGRP